MRTSLLIGVVLTSSACFPSELATPTSEVLEETELPSEITTDTSVPDSTGVQDVDAIIADVLETDNGELEVQSNTCVLNSSTLDNCILQ